MQVEPPRTGRRRSFYNFFLRHQDAVDDCLTSPSVHRKSLTPTTSEDKQLSSAPPTATVSRKRATSFIRKKPPLERGLSAQSALRINKNAFVSDGSSEVSILVTKPSPDAPPHGPTSSLRPDNSTLVHVLVHRESEEYKNDDEENELNQLDVCSPANAKDIIIKEKKPNQYHLLVLTLITENLLLAFGSGLRSSRIRGIDPLTFNIKQTVFTNCGTPFSDQRQHYLNNLFLKIDKPIRPPDIKITPGSDDMPDTELTTSSHPVVQIMVESPKEPPSGDFSIKSQYDNDLPSTIHDNNEIIDINIHGDTTQVFYEYPTTEHDSDEELKEVKVVEESKNESQIKDEITEDDNEKQTKR